MSQDPTTTPTPPDDPTEPPALKRHVLEMHVPDPSRANDAFVAWTAGLGGVLAVAFALVLRLGGPLPVYSGCLALSLFLLGLAVRRYFFDRFPEVVAAEPREVVEEVRVPVTAAVDPRDDEDDDYALIKPLERRGFLTRIIVGAFGALGISLLSLVPSLGPNVGNTLRQTPWARGVRAVSNDGEPLRPEDLAVGNIASVWPDGAIGFERAAVVIIRLSEPPKEPTNMAWVVDETVVGYSKICTHAGCPVALYREQDQSLFCPCHQSTFDVPHACKPTFGPAARALPQLPLGVDDEGFLIAMGDFEELAGPSFG